MISTKSPLIISEKKDSDSLAVTNPAASSTSLFGGGLRKIMRLLSSPFYFVVSWLTKSESKPKATVSTLKDRVAAPDDLHEFLMESYPNNYPNNIEEIKKDLIQYDKLLDFYMEKEGSKPDFSRNANIGLLINFSDAKMDEMFTELNKIHWSNASEDEKKEQCIKLISTLRAVADPKEEIKRDLIQYRKFLRFYMGEADSKPDYDKEADVSFVQLNNTKKDKIFTELNKIHLNGDLDEDEKKEQCVKLIITKIYLANCDLVGVRDPH